MIKIAPMGIDLYDKPMYHNYGSAHSHKEEEMQQNPIKRALFTFTGNKRYVKSLITSGFEDIINDQVISLGLSGLAVRVLTTVPAAKNSEEFRVTTANEEKVCCVYRSKQDRHASFFKLELLVPTGFCPQRFESAFRTLHNSQKTTGNDVVQLHPVKEEEVTNTLQEEGSVFDDQILISILIAELKSRATEFNGVLLPKTLSETVRSVLIESSIDLNTQKVIDDLCAAELIQRRGQGMFISYLIPDQQAPLVTQKDEQKVPNESFALNLDALAEVKKIIDSANENRLSLQKHTEAIRDLKCHQNKARERVAAEEEKIDDWESDILENKEDIAIIEAYLNSEEVVNAFKFMGAFKALTSTK